MTNPRSDNLLELCAVRIVQAVCAEGIGIDNVGARAEVGLRNFYHIFRALQVPALRQFSAL